MTAADSEGPLPPYPPLSPTRPLGPLESRICRTETAQSRPWADIQPELLGLVLRHLPCLADRVRLRAVCRPWRSNSLLHHLPLPFPWLTLPDGTFVSIPGGEIHRMPVPADACCHSSIDNWLFLMHPDGACSLMNPFSKTTVKLPNLVTVWQREILFRDYAADAKSLSYKLMAPLPLDSSPDSLVAALITDDGNCGTLCISQPPIATCSFRCDKEPLLHLWEVAFFDGKLYAVCMDGKLIILEFCKDLGSNPNIKCLIDSFGHIGGTPLDLPSDEVYLLRQYLVECGGRLLMVERLIRDMTFGNEDEFEHAQTDGFEVLEADLRTNPCRWRRVSDLGGHALFVGQHGSKSLPSGECSGYKGDCIYFMCDSPHPRSSLNPLRDSGVFDMRSRTITPLLSGTTSVPLHCNGQWRPAWVFPPEAM